jgi:glycosyltransferase involved in cell wall biosynthesis
MKLSDKTRPDRLAVFLPSLEGGGAEGVMTAVMNGLAQKGVSIDLYLATASGVYLSQMDSRIRIHDLKSASVLRALVPLAAELRRTKPDTLLSAMSHANIVAWLASRISGIGRPRLVLSERMSLEARASFYASLPERVIKALMPRMFSRADAVIVPTASMIPSFVEHSGVNASRFRVIPNPISGSVNSNGEWELGKQLRARGKRIILAVGRLTAVKDYPTLIRAFAGLTPAHHAHLVILGEGSEREALLSLANDLDVAEQVSLPGYSHDPISAMAECDVYVLSSQFEGLPNALLQALSVGARVVSTDCPTGPRELLKDGLLGTLVPVGSVPDMTLAIEKALADDSDRRVAQLTAYSLDHVVNEYEATLFPHGAE